MKLGPLTRQALADIGIDEARLCGIENGTYEWSIGRAPAYGISGDEETARRIAHEAAVRKDFAIKLSRTEATQRLERPYDLSPRARRVYEAAIPNAIGQRIAGIKRYEEALATRGNPKSVVFTEGTPEDWSSVAVAPTWDALAFEFRQAAEALAKASTESNPVPMLPLLTLCRHHLELSLNAIIMAGDQLGRNAVELPTRHYLMPLWTRAMPLMRVEDRLGRSRSCGGKGRDRRVRQGRPGQHGDPIPGEQEQRSVRSPRAAPEFQRHHVHGDVRAPRTSSARPTSGSRSACGSRPRASRNDARSTAEPTETVEQIALQPSVMTQDLDVRSCEHQTEPVPQTLPEYRQPPLIEVVCGLQFNALPLSTVHLGDFWQAVRGRYPTFEDHAPLANIFDDGSRGTRIEQEYSLDMPPLRRVFFVDETKNYLLQLGASRFIANWRKLRDADAYPRFDAAYTRLTEGWDKFREYAARSELGPVRLNQYELTYINHIPEETGKAFPEQANELFSFFRWPGLQDDLVEPNLHGTQLRFSVRFKKSLGSLNVRLQQGERVPDGRRIFILELTARGQAAEDAGDRDTWFAFAHEAIVRTFTSLTTAQAHERWGRSR